MHPKETLSTHFFNIFLSFYHFFHHRAKHHAMTNSPIAKSPSPVWAVQFDKRLSSIGKAAPMSTPTPKPNACPIRSVPGPVPYKFNIAIIDSNGVHGISLIIGPPGN